MSVNDTQKWKVISEEYKNWSFFKQRNEQWNTSTFFLPAVLLLDILEEFMLMNKSKRWKRRTHQCIPLSALKATFLLLPSHSMDLVSIFLSKVHNALCDICQEVLHSLRLPSQEAPRNFPRSTGCFTSLEASLGERKLKVVEPVVVFFDVWWASRAMADLCYYLDSEARVCCDLLRSKWSKVVCHAVLYSASLEAALATVAKLLPLRQMEEAEVVYWVD